MYLLLDDDNIVRCMASEACNLHKNKIAQGMRQVSCAKPQGTVGDKYDTDTNTWEAHPENYPQPSKEELNEQKIQGEIARLTREQAIQNLKDSGELPPDYKGISSENPSQ